MRGQRVGDAARHRRQRRLMEHDLDAAHRRSDRLRIGDVADRAGRCDRARRSRLSRTARAEVVQHAHRVAALQQRLDQVRADEARAARHQTSCHYAPLDVSLDRGCRLRPRSRAQRERKRPGVCDTSSRLTLPARRRALGTHSSRLARCGSSAHHAVGRGVARIDDAACCSARSTDNRTAEWSVTISTQSCAARNSRRQRLAVQAQIAWWRMRGRSERADRCSVTIAPRAAAVPGSRNAGDSRGSSTSFL